MANRMYRVSFACSVLVRLLFRGCLNEECEYSSCVPQLLLSAAPFRDWRRISLSLLFSLKVLLAAALPLQEGKSSLICYSNGPAAISQSLFFSFLL